MKIGSKVLVKGSYHPSNIYRGEIVGESEEGNRPVWVVLVWFSNDSRLEPVKSNYFKDSFTRLPNNTSSSTIFYIEEVENDRN